MARGGKGSGRHFFRRKVRSKEDGSDDSDEDYVVSDDGGGVSDCPEDDCFSLDECASEEGFDGFIDLGDEEEEEEVKGIRAGRRFKRSKPKNGMCDQRKGASKTPRKRARITYEEQKEQEGEGVEDEDEDFNYEEQKEQEGEGVKDEDEDEDFNYDDEDKDEDEDFNYDDDEDEDDEEFTPEEEDYSDEEEETRERKKKNGSMKAVKKVLRRRVSVTSNRGRKRRRSRVSKNPLRKKRRKNGKSRGKVQDNDLDGLIDSGPAKGINGRKKRGRERRRLLIDDSNSDSHCVSVSSDYEFTISEEEREQVREAKKLCSNLRRNLRSASLLMENEEVGVYEDLNQQPKPPGRKGKEKSEEPQGRKGKEKVGDSKSEVGKQVCGICLSEENKRRVRGVLDCCTHYFCFTCIMEWSKVETRCPLCKQRFKTINKPTRSTAGLDLREVVIQVPERDQVYQPSEEELRSYIDPYETVLCSECHQGGDDGLMLLCDICDSPAHTYCVGLGREVPEGNWYCDGCRPVALASLNSQIQERVADSRVSTQNPSVRSSPVLHSQESIDLNLTSSPGPSFSQGFRHFSSSRFSGRSAEGASPASGGGTLSERRWIHRQIHQLLSTDRMTSTTGRTNSISALSSTSNLQNTQIDQSREPTTQHTRTQDVGTSYHTLVEERLRNDISPLMQNGDPFSTIVSNSRRPIIEDSTMLSNRPVNGVLWPGLLGTPTLSDHQPIHQFSSRPNSAIESSLSPAIKEESNFHIVKEQVRAMVKSHLQSLSRDIDLGHSTFKDIARSSTHTLLAACGLEHRKSEVCTVAPPPVCHHMEQIAGEQTSLIKDCCSSCFDRFVVDVVKKILDTTMSSQWLRLGL